MSLSHRRQRSVAALALAAVAALVCCPGTWAQPTGGGSCSPALVSLMPCLSYVTGNVSTPSAQCCSQLSAVVQSNARCLCTLLSSSSPLPFTVPINQTQAMTLPGACKIQTPPLSQCSAVAAAPPAGGGGALPSPVGAPESSRSSPSGPEAASPKSSLPNMPSGNGSTSKATPASSGESSAATSAKFTSPLLLLLFTYSCASVLFNM